MRRHIFKISILLLSFVSMADGQPQAPTQSYPFKSGQSVYLVVMKSNCSPDFASERELRYEFEKRKVFKVASSLQSADFVFLVYLDHGVRVVFNTGNDYTKREYAFAVSPTTYSHSKTDLYNLRDEALWRWETEKDTKFKEIVKMFHDTTLRK